MQLKSLELFGFKSFAERTKLLFDKGITGVVGPNGCGKSNVIDAIRWVLGEQSSKSLRSDKMENVIFNGTDKRKRAGFAEVSITFENTKNILPTEFTSVTITRKLHRDGGSEYYLNNVPCRLKDIENILMDTGIGPDSYAIIELGMVDELLNDKNNARRQLFDEAAGISKYKLRKKETLKKLETTDADLTRVEDVLFEIEKNLKSLEKQAKRAEKYLELKADYRKVSAGFALLKLQEIKEITSALVKQEETEADKIFAIQARVAQLEARILEILKSLADEEYALAEKQKIFNEVVEKIKKLENQKALRAERIKYLLERKEAIENQKNKDVENKQLIVDSLVEIENKLDLANEIFDKTEFYLGELEEELESRKKGLQSLQSEVELNREKLKTRSQKLATLTRNIDLNQLKSQSLKKELDRNKEDNSSRNEELSEYSKKMEEVQANIVVLEEKIAETKAKKLEILNEIAEIQKNIQQLKDQRMDSQVKVDSKKKEHALLKSMMESLEGFPESVKFLSKKKTWAANPVLLSDVFAIDERYKVALENYLEPWMNWYVVDSREEAFAALELLQEKNIGRANFLILNEIEKYLAKNAVKEISSEYPTVLSLADFHERFLPLAKFLLTNLVLLPPTYQASELLPDELIGLQQNGNFHTRLTQLSGGSIGLFEGNKIGRAKNLENLQKEIDAAEEQLIAETAQIAENESLLVQKNKDIPEKLIENLQKEIDTAKQEFSILQLKEKEFKSFLEKTGAQTENLTKELQIIEKELAIQEPEQEKLQDDVAELTEVLEKQEKDLKIKNDDFQEVNKKFNAENLECIKAKNDIDSLKREIRFKREQLTQIETNTKDIVSEKEKLEEEESGLLSENTDNTDQMVFLYARKEQQGKELEALEEQVRMMKATVQKNESAIREERRLREEVDETRNKIKDKLNEQKLIQNSVEERMSVEFQIDVRNLVAEEIFPEGSEKPLVTDLEKSLNDLRTKIQNFGEVNPMAVEAYKEMKDRYDFIVSQRVDILKAKQDLLTTIQEIDETAKELFTSAFTQIRDNFIRVFRSLFTEQDACDLSLTDPNNPTESTIEIIAKPKGKRPLTINQLSGGEKTLTATSLLFAIYLLKPAPFCIFDEVDAPLDDANIDKFNNIIRDFSAESQFLVVTHNKRTMTTTNVIYGVTMPETGVSRIMPVDLRTLNLN